MSEYRLWQWHDDGPNVPNAKSSRVMPLCGWPYISLWDLDSGTSRALTLTANLGVLVLRLSMQISRDGA